MNNEKVMDYFKNPRNMGKMENPSLVGQYTSEHCGDVTTIYLKVEKDIIVDITFETFGCAFAIASGSILTELAKGKSLSEASQITNEDISEALCSVPNKKIHCADLARRALINAIQGGEESC